MLASEARQMVDRIYARIDRRRRTVQEREEYYQGKQPLTFATEEWRKANAARYADFSDNWCRSVADAEAERIGWGGLRFADPSTSRREMAKLQSWWDLNDGDAQASQGFLSSLVASQSFVLVWGDSHDEPIMTWEHASTFEIEYDWEYRRRPIAALKTWADEKDEFATLYTATEVWKWQRKRLVAKDEHESQADQAKTFGEYGWHPREVGNETWPIENPLGVVPAVEIPNRPILAGNPISEIDGVMRMQDAINLLWAYLFLAADYASMPARVVLGATPPQIPILDANGQITGYRKVEVKEVGEKRMLYIDGEGVSIDSWPAASLTPFTDVISMAVGHIQAQTRTPPNYIIAKNGMSNVNGEGLKAAEVGLVQKTREFQTFAGPAMREVHRLMALAGDDDELAAMVRLAKPIWRNPEIRSDAQKADALQKDRALGYPLQAIFERDDNDPAEVDRLMDMVRQEQTDPQLAAAMRVLEEQGAADAAPVVG